MKTSTTETEIMLLLTAAQLLQAADKAPGNLRKRLQLRGEQLLDEAAAEGLDARNRAEEDSVPWLPVHRFDLPTELETEVEVSHDVVAAAVEPGPYSGA
jgi:hypothetical protein